MNLYVCRAVAMDVSRSVIFTPSSAPCLARYPQGRSPSLFSDLSLVQGTVMKKAQPISHLGVSRPMATCWFWYMQGNLWPISCLDVYRSQIVASLNPKYL
jgi:hypothetical protein